MHKMGAVSPYLLLNLVKILYFVKKGINCYVDSQHCSLMSTKCFQKWGRGGFWKLYHATAVGILGPI